MDEKMKVEQDECQENTDHLHEPEAGTEQQVEPEEIAADVALQDALQKWQECEQQYQRLQADYLNFKRRSREEMVQARQRCTVDVVAEFLPTLDLFEKALAFPVAEENKNLLKGFEMVYGQLRAVLTQLGVEEVPTEGKADFHIHNVVAKVENNDLAEDSILEVAKRGYRLGDMLVRPADVVVAVKSNE